MTNKVVKDHSSEDHNPMKDNNQTENVPSLNIQPPHAHPALPQWYLDIEANAFQSEPIYAQWYSVNPITATVSQPL